MTVRCAAGRGSVPTWLGFFDMVVVLVFVAHWLHTRKAVLPQQRILHCAALSASPIGLYVYATG
jgi:hypothetical protein